LIIDDVGAATNTPWQQEMFLDLIDRRYSNEKITIVTTNFMENDCKEHLGERTTRRMFTKENLVINLGPEYAR
jgi:DNA replication protein DnaC